MNKKNLIITIADNNYEKNLCDDFLETVRLASRYDGDIIVLDYGLSRPQALAKYGAEAKHCNRFPQFQKTVDLLRAYHIIEAIELRPEAEHIVYMDGGDIWFQGEIEALFRVDGIALAQEGERWTHPWCQNVIASITSAPLQAAVREALEPHVMMNGGVIAGDRESMISMMNKQKEYTSLLTNTTFGIDQCLYNYMWHTKQFKGSILPRTYNFVTQTHKWEIRNERVWDGDNLISVLHNAGARVLPPRRTIQRQTTTAIPFVEPKNEI